MMVTTTILSTFALSLGGGHAELHPANTNIYYEIPDVRAVLEAYQQAPLASFFRDEEVRSFVAKITDQQPEEVSLASITELSLELLRNQLPAVGGQVIDLIPEMNHVSFSLSGVELDGLADLIRASQGQLTDELRGRLKEVRVRLVMDLSSDTAAMDAADLIRAHASTVPVPGQPTWGQWALVTTSDESPDQIESWTVHEYRGDDLAPSVMVTQRGERVTIGLGLFQDLDHPPALVGTLAEKASYLQARANCGNGGGVTILNTYVSMEGLHTIPALFSLIPDYPPELEAMMEVALQLFLPSGKVEACSRMQLNVGRFVTEEFSMEFNPQGNARLWSDEPITKGTFRMAPPEAVGVSAMHLNPGGLHQHLLEFLGTWGESDIDQLFAELQRDYGFHPGRDLIEPLGGEVVFYTMPYSSIGMPKMYWAIELSDPEAFARGLEGLGRFVADASQGSVEFMSKPYRKQPFMAFNPVEDLASMTTGTGANSIALMTPAFISVGAFVGILEDRAIVSLSSMYTKREMKRLRKTDADGNHPVMASAEDLPSGIHSYATTEWGLILAGLYDSVLGFLPLIVQAADLDLPFSLDEMPSRDVFPRHFQPSVSWSREMEGGTYNYSESSFGPALPFMASALVGAIFFVGSTEKSSMMGVGIGGELGAVQGRRGEEEQAMYDYTLESLNEYRAAIERYKAELGHYPQSLTHLFKRTEGSPKGFFQGEIEPPDAWGAVLLYRRGEDGVSFLLWSRGPDGVDGSVDDIKLRLVQRN